MFIKHGNIFTCFVLYRHQPAQSVFNYKNNK